MPSTRRYMILGLMGLAGLLAMTLARSFGWCLQQLGQPDPLLFGLRELPLSTALAYGVALLSFVGILRYAPSRQLASEIADELARVSWPSRAEIQHATVVVVVCVVVCSVYLGLFDAMWMWATDRILGARAGA